MGLSYFCQATEVIVSDNRESTLLLSLVQAQAYHAGLSDTGPDGIDFGPRKFLIILYIILVTYNLSLSCFSLTLLYFVLTGSYCPKDGYRMILTVAGFVLFLSLIGALIFFVVSWLRPKRRAGYWYL